MAKKDKPPPQKDPSRLAESAKRQRSMTPKQLKKYNEERMTPDQLQAIWQLKQCRKKLHWKQERMAQQLGVSHNTYNKWECGYSKIRHPKILEYALRYIMNTFAVRTPLPGLAARIVELREEERQRYEDQSESNDDTAEQSESGDKLKGDNPTE